MCAAEVYWNKDRCSSRVITGSGVMTETHPPVHKFHTTCRNFTKGWLYWYTMLIASKMITQNKKKCQSCKFISSLNRPQNNNKNTHRHPGTWICIIKKNHRVINNTHSCKCKQPEHIINMKKRLPFISTTIAIKRDCVRMWNSVHNIEPLPSEIWWNMHLLYACWLLQHFPRSLACRQPYNDDYGLWQ